MRANEVLTDTDFLRKKKNERIWRRIVAILSCVVVFSTTFMLILPAITEDQVTYCGREEHVHDAACYEKQLICGAEEHSADAHTEACFKEVLTCQKEEHQHALICSSNPKADVETQETWEKIMADVKLTGVWAEDVIAIAKSQLGYEESDQNYTVTNDGSVKGYSRYGAWYGDPYGDWCTMFVSFCLHYAGVDTDSMPLEASCLKWIDLLKSDKYELYHQADDSYTPHVGDLIFFNQDECTDEAKDTRDADHVGLICELKYDDTGVLIEIKTIEGNYADKVQTITYKADDASILGYGELPENPKEVASLPNSADGSELATQADLTGARENITSVAVTKKWRGAAGARPDAVTIHLYQSGQEYRSTTLNADNNWAYTFESLPYHDEDGKPYSYTISEDSVEGFYTTYSDVNVISDLTAGTHYLKTKTLQTGLYLMACNTDSFISVKPKGDKKTADWDSADAVVSTDGVTYDGIAYDGEVTDDIPTGALWIVTKQSDGNYTFKLGDFKLFRNKDGNPYLAKTINKAGEDSDSFMIDEDGRLYTEITKDKSTKRIYISPKLDGKGSFDKFETKGENEKNKVNPLSFYTPVTVVGAYDKYAYTVTNAYISSDTGETSVTGNKYIDYLGDGGTNPDTELTGEFYRQYLSMQAEGNAGVDFLFVVDTTGSMTDPFGKAPDTNEDIKRQQAVSRVLNGADSRATANGLLTQVLRANPDNKAAVITFCGQVRQNNITYKQALNAKEAILQQDWISLDDDSQIAPYTNVLHGDGYGTCYAMGVRFAADVMQSELLKDDGNRKVVVFLGDGEPNAIITGPDGKGGGRSDAATVDELDNENNIFFNWKPSSAAFNTRPTVDYLVESTKDILPNDQEHIDIYSISVGYDRTGDSDILGYMAEKGDGKKFVVNSPSETISAFREIISNYCAMGAKITDNISKYAELNKENLDFKVTRERISDHQQTVIWEGSMNGGGTIGAAKNGGESYIKSVAYAANSSADSTGTVTVTFQPSYVLEPGIKYVVSYNLKATDTAKDKYAADKTYDHVGDNNTDYDGNATSSGKTGYYSNESAVLSYTKNGGENVVQYPHPVIQVTPNEPEPATTTLTINKNVLGAVTDEKFTFKAVLPDGTFPAPGEDDTYTVDESGAAIFRLGDKDSITLPVPMNAAVIITEISHDGYYTIFKNGQVALSSEDTVNVTIGKDPVVIDVTNSAGAELPATGGPGTSLFTLCGLALMTMAGVLMYKYYMHRRRERRAEQS